MTTMTRSTPLAAPGLTPPGPDARRRVRPRRRNRHRPAWDEEPSLAGSAAKGLLLVVICLVTTYPMIAVLATSLSSQEEIAAKNGLVLWPSRPTLAAYEQVFSGGVVAEALMRSVGITVVGTVSSVVLTVLMAYGLSRPRVVGGRFWLMSVLATMFFSAGIIPSFLVVSELGLRGHYAAVILPTIISAFNLVVVRSFFMSLPAELFEAARIDGAGELRILATIVMPLSRGVVAVISLFYGVAYWNAFFNAMLYLDMDQWPVSMILRQYVLLGQPVADTAATSEVAAPSQALQMAVVVVSLLPILIVYPLLQRYFTKGVLTGAVKG
ncbi:carbohydrate ABC transporter permease [Xylanimonas ulmi]|uniref:Carbohydrate ABC transporter membrane protein 2 (CUT1 family) n=1 Tax=Xylanimonas ulmi TaxID=228973 RepID=A0A4Q7M228_9MICO|nr:carbohydrate ABC transporter permease [Xylanibacterium ulmi]RZS61013.1 carbohydrate ABC transporter membrane protein 2 (CUT1 family) [Xylanibacterium ulmi]